MDRGEHYEDMAAQCLKVAQSTDSPTSKLLLLQRAQAWVKLAEQVRDAEIVSSDPEGE
jgi:hypothetical protein